MYESVPVPRIVVGTVLQSLAYSIHPNAIDQLWDLPQDIQLIGGYGDLQEHGIREEEEEEVEREELLGQEVERRAERRQRRRPVPQRNAEDEVVCGITGVSCWRHSNSEPAWLDAGPTFATKNDTTAE
jgi:hypothetical protein